MFCVVLACLSVMSAMYGCIMCILYRYQQQEYATISQRKAKRHIRGLITSFIILGLFAILWLPNCLMDAYAILRMTIADDIMVHKVHQKVYWYLYALVILNAICDPIVYAMRMREIQESLKILLCFKRPTFSNKMNGFGDSLKPNSTGSIPLKYVQRQFSNSTNVTVCSNGGGITAGGQGYSNNTSIIDRPVRQDTLTSQQSGGTGAGQVSDIDEEMIPLHHQDTNLSLLDM